MCVRWMELNLGVLLPSLWGALMRVSASCAMNDEPAECDGDLVFCRQPPLSV